MHRQLAPETAEGWAVLHQFFHFERFAFAALAPEQQQECVAELSSFLEAHQDASEGGQTAAFHLFGHSGDLLFVHFRKDFELLAQSEQALSRLSVSKFFRPSYSYLSVVELGMYSATVAVRERLKEKGIEENSDEWNSLYRERITEVVESMKERLYLSIPETKFVCFYPMSKKRNGMDNWYVLPIEERNSMMASHGRIGREFRGRVVQVISGSIGFDDWEWGVDLFADDPLVFKELVYVMRFDEGSARYGDFGPFYVGKRISLPELPSLLGAV